MKHFKSNTETDKGWLAVVYKMKEAEADSKKREHLEEKVNTILKGDEIYITIPEEPPLIKKKAE